MAKPILYSYFRSSCSWRVRIALALKQIDYEYKAVHLIKDGGQQHTDEFASINPMKQVPALVIDGLTLTDSLAIIEYLDETRSDGVNILPKDPAKRAQSRMIAQMIASGIQPIQNLAVLQKVGDEKKAEWGHYWIERGFEAVEKVLMKTAGKYCNGDELTLPDLLIPAQVFNANRFKVDMSQFPIISKINEELSKHEAFSAAHPSNQPDCPNDLK